MGLRESLVLWLGLICEVSYLLHAQYISISWLCFRSSAP